MNMISNKLKTEINDYFKDYKEKKNITNSSVKKFLNLNNDIKTQFDEIIKNDYRFNSYFDIIFYCKFYDSFVKCKERGNDLTFKQMQNSMTFCSVKCSKNNDETQRKFKETNLKKYGCENPYQSPAIREKIKQTMLEKYGVEYASKSDAIKNKLILKK